LMCQFETSWENESDYVNEFPEIIEGLHEIINDNLVTIEGKKIIVTEKGKPFVRNICMAFDLRLKRKMPKEQVFSMTI